MTGIFKYIKINWATATSRFPWLADYFVLTETAFYEVTGKGVWTVVPKGFRLGSEETLAGEHADHLLYIIDEASGVSDRAFGIITGALTGQDNRILLLSQPTRPSGYFYDTHHKLAKRPGNPDGVYTAITLNSEESPLVTSEFIKMKLAEYGGRDNPMYMIKVRGLFLNYRTASFLDVMRLNVRRGGKSRLPKDGAGLHVWTLLVVQDGISPLSIS